MTTDFTTTNLPGITASLNDLIRVRPDRRMTGFAPSGKVATHQWGSNQSVFKGRGMEFAESRTYQAGDDVRNIDWRVTARTGKTHSKLFQEERERPVQLLVDMRVMMQFGTRKRFKSNLAAEVAAQLAWVGYDGGDRVGGLLLTRSGMQAFRGARTRRSVLHFLEHLSAQTQPSSQALSQELPQDLSLGLSLAQGIHRLRKITRPGTLVFILTDGHDFDHQAAQELTRLAQHTHLTFIQISDVFDKALPPSGRLSDGADVVALGGLSKQQRSAYATAYQQRQQHLLQTCRQHGIVLHHLQTDDNPTAILRPRRQR